MNTMMHRHTWLGPVLFLAAFGLAPLWPGGYVLYIFSLVLIYSLASFGTNILTGYTNLISLAGAVFFGIGAYGVAILTKQGVPLVAAMLIAASVATVVGLLLALPVLRLEEVFLAIVAPPINQYTNIWYQSQWLAKALHNLVREMALSRVTKFKNLKS